MAFGGMGLGFLPTDPRRGGKGPTGGSYKASQGSDTSVIITGDPSSGGIGFASPRAKGPSFGPTVAPAPDPETVRLTAAERAKRNEDRGVATTHQNMGALSVDFRASEQALADSGQQTLTQQREAKVFDAREEAEHRRLVTDPANREAAKFRAQATGAKNMMNMFKPRKTSMPSSYQRSKRGGLGLAGGQRSNIGGASARPSKSGLLASQTTNQYIGPDFSGMFEGMSAELGKNVREKDPLALGALREHSQAPSNNPTNWQDMADAQSASGKATPTQMAQAAASMHSRRSPNK